MSPGVWKLSSIPAGSFKCDKLVRSSLASSMAGFIKGGRFASPPSWTPASVVSTVLVCSENRQLPIRRHLSQHGLEHRRSAYLAILELKHQLDLVPIDLLVRHLRGNPALGRVWLPRTGADFVNVRHGARRVSAFLVAIVVVFVVAIVVAGVRSVRVQASLSIRAARSLV